MAPAAVAVISLQLALECIDSLNRARSARHARIHLDGPVVSARRSALRLEIAKKTSWLGERSIGMLPLADAALSPVTIVRCVGPVNEPVASRANRSIAIAVGETFLVATPLERIPTVADPSVVEIGKSYADDARTFWILHARAAGDTAVTFDESNRKRSQVHIQVKVSAAPERAC